MEDSAAREGDFAREEDFARAMGRNARDFTPLPSRGR